MKSYKKIWGIALLAFMLMLSAPHKSSAQEGEYISNQEFYDELQPYGTWVYDQNYGNVWIPDVEEDFKPYATNGYWALTEYGNTWVSNYPWGWATFHYGRWHFDDYYGWEWVPGNEWAPAWVGWRNGGGYYGWAPLEPGITVDAYFGNDYDVPDNYWVFAPQQYITYTNIYNYYVPQARVYNIINRTTYIRNRYVYDNRTYITGPRRDEIQRVIKRPVRLYNIRNVDRPSRITVNNNNINIYRPNVRVAASARPSRVVNGSVYRQQNPEQRIGLTDRRRGTVYNAANASRLAETARNNNPDTRVVRVNGNNDSRNSARQERRPDVNNADRTRLNDDNFGQRQQRPQPMPDQQAQQQQMREQQQQIRQQQVQQQQQANEQRQNRDRQQTQQREQQLQQQRQQQVQQQQQANEQRQNRDRQQIQQREQQLQQQRQQQVQQQQQANEQRQNRDRQQAQQQQQQAQQQQQQREQQMQQQRQQQAQQQQQQREQQMQQQRQQQAQQQQQQREQQAREQQRQQQQQAREQQRQQQQQQKQDDDRRRQRPERP